MRFFRKIASRERIYTLTSIFAGAAEAAGKWVRTCSIVEAVILGLAAVHRLRTCRWALSMSSS
jgi:hypothetical protein